MEFAINLTHRFILGKCEVCLKSLTIPSRIYNVYDDKQLRWAFQMSGPGIPSTELDLQKLKPGYYTRKDVIKKIP